MTAPAPTVLIVDDEAHLRRVLARALGDRGYRVLSAGSAETAYELLNSEQAEALLLDIRMPTMSGLSLYLAIVHRWPHLEGRIALMTGDADASEVAAWLEHHRCMVIRKPFELRQIFEWLETVVRSRGREAGNA